MNAPKPIGKFEPVYMGAAVVAIGLIFGALALREPVPTAPPAVAADANLSARYLLQQIDEEAVKCNRRSLAKLSIEEIEACNSAVVRQLMR